jgi:hypothetical protein
MEKYESEIIEKARKMHWDGNNTKDIAIFLGIPYGTVYGWIGGGMQRVKQKPQVQGKNADRHLCRTCMYRGYKGSMGNGCDYIYIKNHSRGSSVADCNRYERGKRKKATKI